MTILVVGFLEDHPCGWILGGPSLWWDSWRTILVVGFLEDHPCGGILGDHPCGGILGGPSLWWDSWRTILVVGFLEDHPCGGILGGLSFDCSVGTIHVFLGWLRGAFRPSLKMVLPPPPQSFSQFSLEFF